MPTAIARMKANMRGNSVEVYVRQFLGYQKTELTKFLIFPKTLKIEKAWIITLQPRREF
jgi:hypothetical protein